MQITILFKGSREGGQGAREGGAGGQCPLQILTLHVLVSCLLAVRINENVYSNYFLK